MPLPLPHPILVHFPLALVPVSLLSDVLGRMLGRPSLRDAGWWAMLYAGLAAPFTAWSGWVWMHSMADMDHPQMWTHQWLGFALGVALPLLALLRGWQQRRGCVTGWYLAAVAMALVGLVYQGYLGGQMSFE